MKKYRVYIEGAFLVVKMIDDGSYAIDKPKHFCACNYRSAGNGDTFLKFTFRNSLRSLRKRMLFSEIEKEDGSSWTDIEEFKAWIRSNLGHPLMGQYRDGVKVEVNAGL